MISRTKRNNSRHSSDLRPGAMVLPSVSQNRYKQTKLPLRFLNNRRRESELNFVLNSNFEGAFLSTQEVQEKGEYQFLFQFKWVDLKQFVNVYCFSGWLKDLEIKVVEGSRRRTEKELERDRLWFSILKSHLQKAVRRGLTGVALATCRKMLEVCPVELLRRLPIIMIEDVQMDACVPTLIWLMVYYSDRLSRCFTHDSSIKLSDRVVNWVYSVVEHWCRWTVYDAIEYKNEEWNWRAEVDKIDDRSIRDCLYALQVRASYGGMGGDLEMLRQYTRLWCQRWTDDSSKSDWMLAKPVIKDYDRSEILELTRENFILEAIDFHPCPWFLDRLFESSPSYLSRQVIQDVIWHTCSAVNYRRERGICRDYQITLTLFRTKWMRLATEVRNRYL